MKSLFASPRAAAAWRLTLATAALGAQAFAQSAPAHFVPFNTFMESTMRTSAGAFLSTPDTKVKQTADFDQMRLAVMNRYAGVKVSHSFMLDSQHYDCVALNQQPAMRTYGLKSIASPPPADLLKQHAVAANAKVQPAAPLSAASQFDAFGNSTSCESGTVPLLRVDLDTMSHFSTLQDFYRKPTSQGQAAPSSSGFASPAVATHKYSYTYQNVNNLGGNSNLNLWSPYVSTSQGEIFSLSQEWYIGGSGAGLQTEEVGWVVYPGMFNNDQKAHFFIYSTAGNYAAGTGCWNNSCGDFVQVASSGLLGNSFSNYSSFGGTQYEFSAEYYLYQGNWWLSFQGTWVGYYPGAKYKGGQLTKYAQTIEFGSESVGSTIWPPEGSGKFSNTGFGQAAYQRNLWYIATTGTSYWDSLTAVMPSPRDYTISGPYSSSSAGWTRYFYEGGPGGIY